MATTSVLPAQNLLSVKVLDRSESPLHWTMPTGMMRAGRKSFGVMSVHSTQGNREKTMLFRLRVSDSVLTAFNSSFGLVIQASVSGPQLAEISSQILSS